MSLLDADIHSAHPSVIIDADAMFSEDISYFGYPSFRRSSLSRLGSSRGNGRNASAFEVLKIRSGMTQMYTRALMDRNWNFFKNKQNWQTRVCVCVCVLLNSKFKNSWNSGCRHVLMSYTVYCNILHVIYIIVIIITFLNHVRVGGEQLVFR